MALALDELRGERLALLRESVRVALFYILPKQSYKSKRSL